MGPAFLVRSKRHACRRKQALWQKGIGPDGYLDPGLRAYRVWGRMGQGDGGRAIILGFPWPGIKGVSPPGRALPPPWEGALEVSPAEHLREGLRNKAPKINIVAPARGRARPLGCAKLPLWKIPQYRPEYDWAGFVPWLILRPDVAFTICDRSEITSAPNTPPTNPAFDPS